MQAITELDYKLPNLFDMTGSPASFNDPVAHVLPCAARTLMYALALPAYSHRLAWDPYEWCYNVPSLSAHEAPDLTRKLADLIRWTNWSHRELAQVIGSTHPTVSKVLRGHTSALSRSSTQRRRLDDVHAVVSRIYLLAGRDAAHTTLALSQPGDNGQTAIQLLIDGQAANAYLVAMRALRPPRTAEMMIGSNPLDARRASVAVLDED